MDTLLASYFECAHLSFNDTCTVMRIIKLIFFRYRSGCTLVPKINFVLISPYCAIFKNVVHRLNPDETPSYSASHQAPNYVQPYQISQNTLKRFDAVAVRLRLFFFNILMFSTVHVVYIFFFLDRIHLP